MPKDDIKEVIEGLLKTPKEMVQDILEENAELRKEYFEIQKKITRMASHDIYACVEELIKERSVEILPEYIEPIFNKECRGGCCVAPPEKWDPTIGCYEYRDTRTDEVVDLYFGDYDTFDQEIVGHLKRLCEKLTDEVGIPFYVYEQDEEMREGNKKFIEEEKNRN